MKLKSMDVNIRGVQRTFEFDPATPVDSDDDGEASLELLGEAETFEVQLVKGVSEAKVTVEYTMQWTSSVEVLLEDLEDQDIEDDQDIINLVEGGDYDPTVNDAIESDIQDNVDDSWYQISSILVDSVIDDSGDSIEL